MFYIKPAFMFLLSLLQFWSCIHHLISHLWLQCVSKPACRQLDSLTSVCVIVSIQPEPELQILTYGSTAMFMCQLEETYQNFSRIKWTVTIDGLRYNELADIPLSYGKGLVPE